MGDLARDLGMSLMELQRKNVVVPGDAVHSIWEGPSDAEIGSYGLDQCMDFVEQALASGRGSTKPRGDEWLEGKGHAIHMHDCIPPTEQRPRRTQSAPMARHLANGATEMGNGTITTMRQIAATIPTRLRPGSISSMPIPIVHLTTRAFSSVGTSFVNP
jgi:CO/xanthine dehydrogenase Mo-binding subunit